MDVTRRLSDLYRQCVRAAVLGLLVAALPGRAEAQSTTAWGVVVDDRNLEFVQTFGTFTGPSSVPQPMAK